MRIVYLEDIRPTIGVLDKLRGLLNWKKPLVARKPDDWAVILFTSGSEGPPKGVVLSHRNMLANVAQAAARIDFGREDKVFNVLPVFHSFGLTGGMVLPLVSGVPIYLYPSPLHYRIVPELVYGVCATILFGTDTFLAGYARVANPYDFRSLRYVLAGAEPVKETTRRVYLEKFGLRILEGYGVTETSPVLALNTPMFNKFGTVGRLLPGMEARLEKVEGVDEGGRLFVRGPNVMLGYLRADKPGVLEPPPEGWHDTGDIVTIDEQGFIAIKGRAKRFAKIGGEMVSLAAVEMLAAELWPNNVTAVAAVPDARKGERLIMVTDKHGATRGEFLAYARSKHASELMLPSEVIVLDKLPMLGSGKVDQSGARRNSCASRPRRRPRRRSDFRWSGLRPVECLRPHRQHAVDHRAGLAEIIRRIAEFRERGAVEVLGDLRVLGEQIDQRPAGGDHFAADVVDQIMRVLAAEIGAEPHHHRLRNDEALGEIEIGAHLLLVDLQAVEHETVCASAPAARQKISGSTIHSISHGPVARSWSSTMASSSAATCWRTTEVSAVM